MPKRLEYDLHAFRREAPDLFVLLRSSADRDAVRLKILAHIRMTGDRLIKTDGIEESQQMAIIRDCQRVLCTILNPISEKKAGFSLAQILWDLANGRGHKDLTPAFFAEMAHLWRGVTGRATTIPLVDSEHKNGFFGRVGANARSDELDELWAEAEREMSRFPHGLQEEVIQQRSKIANGMREAMGATEAEWSDWRWQVRNVLTELDQLDKLFPLMPAERKAIRQARQARLPFGVTPFYLSLMDPSGQHDAALRAQVFPPQHYVDQMGANRDRRECAFDFMGERDTSPIDLVTRRYPAIAIFKPFNTCPQICVYCQRNWEIEEAMAKDAMASKKQMEAALRWFEDHPAIHEVLVTGGDPLVLEDEQLKWILDRLANIKSIERIRLGSRTLVTLPTRYTEDLVNLLGSYREPGRREVALVTHVEHPYELNPAMVQAVDRVRRQGIAVYNQLVYTFYVSRRFEATLLRRLLRLVGIDPYYSFNTKGKEETKEYRVPIPRLLQEQKEESRLLPGLARTDEAVYNVPRLGKVYLRASQHHDLISILPDGSRLYEFHPWEKNILPQETYINKDVPILDYLARLEAEGEDLRDYQSIWYYF